MTSSDPILVDIDEIAERLSLSVRTVYDITRRSVRPLPSIKIGRRRLYPVAKAWCWAEDELEAQAEGLGEYAELFGGPVSSVPNSEAKKRFD